MSAKNPEAEAEVMTPQTITRADDTRFRAFLRYLLDLPPYLRHEALEYYRVYGAVQSADKRAL